MLPYFLEHYSKIANKIIVYDNCSSDASPDIVRSCGKAELRSFDTNGYFDDSVNLKIKNNAYKESVGVADFVIVVDTDEFLYHKNLYDILLRFKHDSITLPVTVGYDMVSWKFPRKNKQLTELIKIGRKSDYYSKRCIFAPSIDINYRTGCHKCSPIGNIVENTEDELKVLHYHYIGFIRNVYKHRACRKRLSNFNKVNNLGYQFTWGSLRLMARFFVYQVNSHDVINNKPSILNTIISPFINMMKDIYWKSKANDKWRP